MSIQPHDGIFDPQIDVPRSRFKRPPVGEIVDYQRLLVNPALSLVTGLGLAALLRYSLQVKNLLLFLVCLGSFFLPFIMIQFHCLDCGATGWYLYRARHNCSQVMARWERRQVPGFPTLSGRQQLLAWAMVLLTALLYYGLLWRSRP